MKKNKRVVILTVCLLVAIIFIAMILVLLWRNSVLDRYIQIPDNNDLSRFVDSQDNLDVVAVFSDPAEIEEWVDSKIDRETYESCLVSLVQSNLHEDDYQVNYLFQEKKTGKYGTISFIRFHNTESALFKFNFAIDYPLTKTEYVTPWRFCMLGEPNIDFFFPTLTQRGYEEYALEDGLMRSYWFENDRGIQLTVESSQHENIRQEFIQFCKEM